MKTPTPLQVLDTRMPVELVAPNGDVIAQVRYLTGSEDFENAVARARELASAINRLNDDGIDPAFRRAVGERNELRTRLQHVPILLTIVNSFIEKQVPVPNPKGMYIGCQMCGAQQNGFKREELHHGRTSDGEQCWVQLLGTYVQWVELDEKRAAEDRVEHEAGAGKGGPPATDAVVALAAVLERLYIKHGREALDYEWCEDCKAIKLAQDALFQAQMRQKAGLHA